MSKEIITVLLIVITLCVLMIPLSVGQKYTATALRPLRDQNS